MGESPTSDATAEAHSSLSPTSDATAEAQPLPSPPPAAGTLVYDGNCGFCTTTARWAKRRLSDEYRVLPSQQADLAALGLTHQDVARSAWWIDAHGSRSDEHRCFAKALSAMGNPWPVVGRLLTLGPISPVAGWAYRLVANNRHRLPRFGRPAKCDRQP